VRLAQFATDPTIAKNLDCPQLPGVFPRCMTLLYVAPAAWLAVTTFIVAACGAASSADACLERDQRVRR
jgi:hypothetical protein